MFSVFYAILYTMCMNTTDLSHQHTNTRKQTFPACLLDTETTAFKKGNHYENSQFSAFPKALFLSSFPDRSFRGYFIC